MVSLVSDIVVGISAAVVAALAFFGLQTWRKELIGKAKFDLARNIMLLGIRLESAFQWVRFPPSSSRESLDRQRKENESAKESQVLDEWYIRWDRLRPLVENLQKLQELGWEAEVVFGEEASRQVSEAIKTFRGCFADLSTAIESYFETRHDEITTDEPYNDQGWLEELRKEIYQRREDELSQKISGAKDQLASALKAYVK